MGRKVLSFKQKQKFSLNQLSWAPNYVIWVWLFSSQFWLINFLDYFEKSRFGRFSQIFVWLDLKFTDFTKLLAQKRYATMRWNELKLCKNCAEIRWFSTKVSLFLSHYSGWLLGSKPRSPVSLPSRSSRSTATWFVKTVKTCKNCSTNGT